ncbi:MAG: 30S ribosomal protein S8 [Simkaniaceae bacterium]|nr:30S ribosomal protein S8 [Simkaniaceae bacterium]
MSLNDPIADLLTRIRNAKDAQHRYVDVSYSKLVTNIANVLLSEGFIVNVLVNEDHRTVRIFLKYERATRNSIISGITRLSKPGLRKYVGYQNIPYVHSGLGTVILSTPKGVMDSKRARKEKVGGELICKVW